MKNDWEAGKIKRLPRGADVLMLPPLSQSQVARENRNESHQYLQNMLFVGVPASDGLFRPTWAAIYEAGI
jgi:hypothetical protein